MEHTEIDFKQSSSRLINGIHTAARDSIEGFVFLHPHTSVLQIGATVVRKDYQELQTFRIVSGGPTGHEPMYCGYIGKGMLTASVQGEVFKAPTTSEILAVIREMTFASDCGVLVIVQHSSACTLNFALAVEKALAEGLQVKSILVGDDCTLSTCDNERQGLTGAVITAKVAGAMSELGASLCETHAYCEHLQHHIATVLLVLKPCSLLASRKCTCGEANLSVGGPLRAAMANRRKVKCSTAVGIVEELVEELGEKMKLEAGASVVVMINNMCCSQLEENIFTLDLIQALQARNLHIQRIYIGTFMSVLDLQGFSVTLVPSDAMLLRLLDSPTDAPSWKVRLFGVEDAPPISLQPHIKVRDYPKFPVTGPNLSARESNIMLLVLQFACDAIISCSRQLDIMDAERGDGDLGERLETAAQTILNALQTEVINISNMYVLFRMLAHVADTISGSLGAIYSIVFESCASTFAACSAEVTVDEKLWILCLRNAIDVLSRYSFGGSITRGFIEPLAACLFTLNELHIVNKMPILDAFERAVASAEEVALKTVTVDSRISGQSKKYPDAESHAVGIWLRAVFEGVKFRCQF